VELIHVDLAQIFKFLFYKLFTSLSSLHDMLPFILLKCFREDGKKKKKPEAVSSSSSTPVKKDKVTIEDVEEAPTDPLERAVAAKNRGMYLS